MIMQVFHSVIPYLWPVGENIPACMWTYINVEVAGMTKVQVKHKTLLKINVSMPLKNHGS